MKKVFYDSWLAKAILFPSYSTITLFAWVFTKWSKTDARQSTINHECVHARQWIELTVASGLLLWAGGLIFGYSAWWLALSAVIFYLWYVLEWCIRLIGNICNRDAYHMVSFERKARLAERDNNYLENSHYFAWLKFYKK